jgi:hypothetical protein
VLLGSPAETVNTTAGSYVDLDESDSGPATGLKGPCFGNYYAFKAKQLWELRPTGDVTRPFAATALSKTIGAVNHQSIVIGEDERGAQALYFVSDKGPYRYSTSGLEYIGRTIEVVFSNGTAQQTINLAATSKSAHATYHPEVRQVWFWFATNGGNDGNALYVFHCDSGAWTVFSGGNVDQARCSALLPETLGATMSRRLKPYSGHHTTAGRLTKHDDQTVTTDTGTAVVTQLRLRPVLPGGAGLTGHAGDPLVLASGSGTTLTVTSWPNLDATSSIAPKQTSVLLTPNATYDGSGPRVFRRASDLFHDQAYCVEYEFSTTNGAFVLDQIVIPVRAMGPPTT